MAPKQPMIQIRDLPEGLVCPITYHAFLDPVDTVPCSHTFSKAAINRWIETKGDKAKCPCCNGLITQKGLVANDAKALEVRQFLDPIASEIVDRFGDNPIKALQEGAKHDSYSGALYSRLNDELTIDANNQEGEAALVLAIQEGSVELFDALIACGAQLDRLIDRSPLITLAVKSGNLAMLHQVLSYFYERITTPYDRRKSYKKESHYTTERVYDESIPNLSHALRGLYGKTNDVYLSMSSILMDYDSSENQNALAAALAAKNELMSSLIFSLGVKTIYENENGDYYDITDVQDPSQSIVTKVNGPQFENWCACRSAIYIFEKRQMIYRYKSSVNVFLKLWGFILELFNQAKIKAARHLCFYAMVTSHCEREWYAKYLGSHLLSINTGELGETVFKPYLRYSQQRGVFSIREGETLQTAWLRSITEAATDERNARSLRRQARADASSQEASSEEYRRALSQDPNASLERGVTANTLRLIQQNLRALQAQEEEASNMLQQ